MSSRRRSSTEGMVHRRETYNPRLMHPLRATPRHARAIEAVAELLSKLRIESMFVGSVARAVWLGGLVESGAIDILGLMQPQQKNQVAMMASNRGFRVDAADIDRRAFNEKLVSIGLRELAL